jgi:hypothetical protein
VRLAVAAEEKKLPETPSVVWDHFQQQRKTATRETAHTDSR